MGSVQLLSVSLRDRVRITPRFQRAVRIDSDLAKAETLQGFLCTPTFARAITTICEQMGATGQGAYTITGPFGSGKSSLLVAFASAIGPKGRTRDLAQAALGPLVTQVIAKNMAPSVKGWRVVPILGARAAPVSLTVDGLERSRFVRQRKDRRKQLSEVSVLETIKRLADDPRYRGLLLIIDELGKVLEHLASTGGDLQFFQNLAELASRSKGRLLVVGVLHQAFDEYVGRAGRSVRDEWAKVQGRYLDIPLSVTTNEQIELMSKAIMSDHVPKAHAELSDTVSRLLRKGRLDAGSRDSAHFKKCWPLHPVTACLLGAIARRRFGQNQRSLFGFLNSHEPSGFQDFLASVGHDGIYTPDRLFDYLQSNLEPSILASPDGHRWALAAESLDRVEKRAPTPYHVSIIKSIALLDLFRERAGLLGSEEVLDTLYPNLNRKVIASVLTDLVSWSVVTYRAHLSGYSLFAGSDFDVQLAMDDALTKVGSHHLVDVKSLANLRPVVAKRHYHETGALRWFDIDVVALGELPTAIAKARSATAMGAFVLVVPTEGESENQAQEMIRSAAMGADEHVVLGQCKNAPRLLELSRELSALDFIRQNRGELAGDGVARREVEAKIAAVLAHLESEVRVAFGNTNWYWRAKDFQPIGMGGLSRLGSDLADAIYPKSPRIQSELLNRSQPSSNAIAAQKALLKAMVSKSKMTRLGIEGYPAEGGLYESLLGKTGLHETKGSHSRFAAPVNGDDSNLYQFWACADSVLERAIREPVSAKEIYKVWQSAPFGMREGLQPVIFLAYLMTRLDRYTIYLQNQMEAELTDLTVDIFVQDPAQLTLRVYDPDARKRRLFTGVRDSIAALLPDTSDIDLEDIVGLARGLVAIVRNQPAFSLRTGRLSRAALSIRAAIRSASDPHILLHETLPAALNQEIGRDGASVKEQTALLHDALNEIANVYADTLSQFSASLFRELGIPLDEQRLITVRERASQIQGLTGDLRLEALVSRLANYSVALTDTEGLASLAANKPSRDWSDNDVDRAILEAADLAQRFNRAEAFARVKGRQDGRHSVAFVVGLDHTPELASSEFDITEIERVDVLKLAREIRALADADGARREIVLAAIAHVGSDILGVNKGTAQQAALGN